jgi:L-lactate dehydrogenase complex protein LldG
MSTRDVVLGRVRDALTSADRAPVHVTRGYRAVGDAMTSEQVVDLFVERVEDYRARVVRCAPDEVEAVVAEAVVGRRVVVPEGLRWRVAHELDAIDGAVTGAVLGIAVTGTLVLDHGPGQGRRALSLVPDLHVCVVAASAVVAGVPQAVERLDPTRPQTWISGPSATSDIELDRVEGVHGPRTLVVVVVDDL